MPSTDATIQEKTMTAKKSATNPAVKGSSKSGKARAPRSIETTVPNKPRKLSALDAAAKALGEAGASMNCKQLIETMAAKGYWTSPGGKTPHSTLYATLLKEITTKGAASRFAKVDPGQFALRDSR
jgi:hypothetical protein